MAVAIRQVRGWLGAAGPQTWEWCGKCWSAVSTARKRVASRLAAGVARRLLSCPRVNPDGHVILPHAIITRHETARDRTPGAALSREGAPTITDSGARLQGDGRDGSPAPTDPVAVTQNWSRAPSRPRLSGRLLGPHGPHGPLARSQAAR